MKICVGNDIIETKRIEKIYNKYTDKFINKVFTKNEIDYCEAKKAKKYESYAARFAGKEAVFKAISSSIANKYSVEWKDIEILNDSTGRPSATIRNDEFKGSIDISLSHIKEYAIATAIVYFE